MTLGDRWIDARLALRYQWCEYRALVWLLMADAPLDAQTAARWQFNSHMLRMTASFVAMMRSGRSLTAAMRPIIESLRRLGDIADTAGGGFAALSEAITDHPTSL